MKTKLINSMGTGAAHFSETILCKKWQSLLTFLLVKVALPYIMTYSREKVFSNKMKVLMKLHLIFLLFTFLPILPDP